MTTQLPYATLVRLAKLEGKLTEVLKTNPCHSSADGKFCATGGSSGGSSSSGGTKKTITSAVATKGASLAEDLMRTDRAAEYASGRVVDLQFSRKQKDKKLLPAATAEKDKAWKAYHEKAKQSEAYQKEHGLSTVEAWEAKNGRRWPHYKVNFSGSASPTGADKFEVKD